MGPIYLPSKKEPKPYKREGKVVRIGAEAAAILEELHSRTLFNYNEIADMLIQAAYPHVQLVERRVYDMYVRGEQPEGKNDD